MAQQLVSFKLDAFSAGGIMPSGDYVLKNHEIVLWDYDGKLPVKTLAMRCTASLVGSEDETVQHYSIGDPSAFGPSADGKGVVALGGRSQLSNSSNFFIWLENFINAGFPEGKYDNDISVFNGSVVHIDHIPAPNRGAMKSNLVAATEGQQRERTIPVVTAVLSLPGESKKPAAKTAAKAAPAKAAASVAAEPASDDSILVTHLGQVLNGEASMSRTQVRVAVFKSMTAAKIDTKLRDAALRAFNDDTELETALMGVGNGFAIDGANIVAVA